MQQVKPLPAVHVTNYQQYINATALADRIVDHLPPEASLPEGIYVSISYMQVQRQGGIFKTTLVLSIKGYAYRFALPHNEEPYYIAHVGLSCGTFTSPTAKDMQIRIYQQAFEAVVEKNIKQITKAIITAYEIR